MVESGVGSTVATVDGKVESVRPVDDRVSHGTGRGMRVGSGCLGPRTNVNVVGNVVVLKQYN